MRRWSPLVGVEQVMNETNLSYVVNWTTSTKTFRKILLWLQNMLTSVWELFYFVIISTVYEGCIVSHRIARVEESLTRRSSTPKIVRTSKVWRRCVRKWNRPLLLVQLQWAELSPRTSWERWRPITSVRWFLLWATQPTRRSVLPSRHIGWRRWVAVRFS